MPQPIHSRNEVLPPQPDQATFGNSTEAAATAAEAPAMQLLKHPTTHHCNTRLHHNAKLPPT
jgi:hypothetical protein